MEALALGVFAGTFAALAIRQLVGRGPRIWVLLGVGAILTVGTGVLTLPGAAEALANEAPVLLFLLALFVLVAALERSGAIEHLARWVASRAGRPEDLPYLLFLTFGLLAGFVLNDALVLVGVPLAFTLARRLRVDAKPLLLGIAYAVSVGSVLTPLGNPQNLLIATDSGLSSPLLVFVRYLALPTAINLVLGAALLRWSARRRAPSVGQPFDSADPPFPLLPRGGWVDRLQRAPVLFVFPAAVVALFGSSLLGTLAGWEAPPSYLIALGAAVLVLLLTPGRVALVRRTDWTILLLFAGLFVVVAGAVTGGLLGGLERLLPVPGASGPTLGSTGTIVGASLLGSQLVSNVPWVALQIPLLHGLGYGAVTPTAWTALAAGSTLAGNLTLLGAASNLIVVEQAESRGVSIRLGEFVRLGLPLAAITTLVVVGCLFVGL